METTDKELKIFVKSYLETALWCSEEELGRCLDDMGTEFTVEHFSFDAIFLAIKECRFFLKQSEELLVGLDLTQVAHDFWLTRNRHGAGFWDGDYEEELGKTLTNISHCFFECSLELGDDEKINFFGVPNE